MGETKEHYISFRVTDDYFEKVNKLSGKLGLDRSQTIRMMLDRGIEEFLDEKSSLRLVSNKQWNSVVEARLENFVEKIKDFNEFVETLPGQVKGAKVQEGVVKMTQSEVGDFLKVCMKEVLEDYDSFSTEDNNPDKKTIREAVKRGIGRAKGKIF